MATQFALYGGGWIKHAQGGECCDGVDCFWGLEGVAADACDLDPSSAPGIDSSHCGGCVADEGDSCSEECGVYLDETGFDGNTGLPVVGQTFYCSTGSCDEGSASCIIVGELQEGCCCGDPVQEDTKLLYGGDNWYLLVDSSGSVLASPYEVKIDNGFNSATRGQILEINPCGPTPTPTQTNTHSVTPTHSATPTITSTPTQDTSTPSLYTNTPTQETPTSPTSTNTSSYYTPTPTPTPSEQTQTPTPSQETPKETPTPTPQTPTPSPQTPTPSRNSPTPSQETPTPQTPTPSQETPTPSLTCCVGFSEIDEYGMFLAGFTGYIKNGSINPLDWECYTTIQQWAGVDDPLPGESGWEAYWEKCACCPFPSGTPTPSPTGTSDTATPTYTPSDYTPTPSMTPTLCGREYVDLKFLGTRTIGGDDQNYGWNNYTSACEAGSNNQYRVYFDNGTTNLAVGTDLYKYCYADISKRGIGAELSGGLLESWYYDELSGLAIKVTVASAAGSVPQVESILTCPTPTPTHSVTPETLTPTQFTASPTPTSQTNTQTHTGTLSYTPTPVQPNFYYIGRNCTTNGTVYFSTANAVGIGSFVWISNLGLGTCVEVLSFDNNSVGTYHIPGVIVQHVDCSCSGTPTPTPSSTAYTATPTHSPTLNTESPTPNTPTPSQYTPSPTPTSETQTPTILTATPFTPTPNTPTPTLQTLTHSSTPTLFTESATSLTPTPHTFSPTYSSTATPFTLSSTPTPTLFTESATSLTPTPHTFSPTYSSTATPFTLSSTPTLQTPQTPTPSITPTLFTPTPSELTSTPTVTHSSTAYTFTPTHTGTPFTESPTPFTPLPLESPTPTPTPQTPTHSSTATPETLSSTPTPTLFTESATSLTPTPHTFSPTYSSTATPETLSSTPTPTLFTESATSLTPTPHTFSPTYSSTATPETLSSTPTPTLFTESATSLTPTPHTFSPTYSSTATPFTLSSTPTPTLFTESATSLTPTPHTFSPTYSSTATPQTLSPSPTPTLFTESATSLTPTPHTFSPTYSSTATPFTLSPSPTPTLFTESATSLTPTPHTFSPTYSSTATPFTLSSTPTPTLFTESATSLTPTPHTFSPTYSSTATPQTLSPSPTPTLFTESATSLTPTPHTFSPTYSSTATPFTLSSTPTPTLFTESATSLTPTPHTFSPTYSSTATPFTLSSTPTPTLFTESATSLTPTPHTFSPTYSSTATPFTLSSSPTPTLFTESATSLTPTPHTFSPTYSSTATPFTLSSSPTPTLFTESATSLTPTPHTFSPTYSSTATPQTLSPSPTPTLFTESATDLTPTVTFTPTLQTLSSTVTPTLFTESATDLTPTVTPTEVVFKLYRWTSDCGTLDSGNFRYVLSGTLTIGNTVSLVGEDGCWMVNETSDQIVNAVVESLRNSCADCLGITPTPTVTPTLFTVTPPEVGYVVYKWTSDCGTLDSNNKRYIVSSTLSVNDVVQLDNEVGCWMITATADTSYQSIATVASVHSSCADCLGITPTPTSTSTATPFTLSSTPTPTLFTESATSLTPTPHTFSPTYSSTATPFTLSSTVTPTLFTLSSTPTPTLFTLTNTHSQSLSVTHTATPDTQTATPGPTNSPTYSMSPTQTYTVTPSEVYPYNLGIYDQCGTSRLGAADPGKSGNNNVLYIHLAKSNTTGYTGIGAYPKTPEDHHGIQQYNNCWKLNRVITEKDQILAVIGTDKKAFVPLDGSTSDPREVIEKTIGGIDKSCEACYCGDWDIKIFKFANCSAASSNPQVVYVKVPADGTGDIPSGTNKQSCQLVIGANPSNEDCYIKEGQQYLTYPCEILSAVESTSSPATDSFDFSSLSTSSHPLATDASLWALNCNNCFDSTDDNVPILSILGPLSGGGSRTLPLYGTGTGKSQEHLWDLVIKGDNCFLWDPFTLTFQNQANAASDSYNFYETDAEFEQKRGGDFKNADPGMFLVLSNVTDGARGIFGNTGAANAHVVTGGGDVQKTVNIQQAGTTTFNAANRRFDEGDQQEIEFHYKVSNVNQTWEEQRVSVLFPEAKAGLEMQIQCGLGSAVTTKCYALGQCPSLGGGGKKGASGCSATTASITADFSSTTPQAMANINFNLGLKNWSYGEALILDIGETAELYKLPDRTIVKGFKGFDNNSWNTKNAAGGVLYGEGLFTDRLSTIDTTDKGLTPGEYEVKVSFNTEVKGLNTEALEFTHYLKATFKIDAAGGETGGGGKKGSDIRLKENVMQIGTSLNNIPIYIFSYIGESQKYIGAVAQDLIKLNRIEAVGVREDGYYEVDYDLIDVDFTSVEN